MAGGIRVDYSYILSTINPVTGFLLSLTFFLIWKKHPERKYILNWSIGFAAGSIGYAFEFFHFFMANFRFANGVNIFLPVSMLFTARGLCLRYTGDAPDRALLLAITFCSVIACWMSFGDHNAVIRGFVVSVGVAVVVIVAMNAILSSKERDRIDLSILMVLLLLAILLPVRPIVSFLIEGAPHINAIEVTSFWAVSLKVGGLFVWIAFALLFLLRIASDLLSELNARSVTDSLSGILNRRGFFDTAGSLVRDATPGLPVSVFLIDIDHFKKVNDTYGHQVGDQVIRNVAKALHANAPEAAVIGRLGGEEFAVVLPNTDRGAAMAFAEALRMNLERQGHAGVSADHPVTVSIGLAQGTGHTLDELLHDADMALYKAKSGGRNRVAVNGGETFRNQSTRMPGRLVRALP
mgnify:CR=1 FL=1